MASLLHILLHALFAFSFIGSSAQDPCQSYNVLSDESRAVFKTGSGYTNDRMTGWYRFMGRAGDKMLDYEPRWQSGVYRCTSLAQGYLYDQHPRGSDGVVSKKVCFSWAGNACYWSTSIQVKNCGNFFVYNLNDLYYVDNTYYGYLRYCGAGEVADTTKNPCQGYNTISDASRSVLNVDQTYTNDHSINGWYRFMGKAGSRMLDYDPDVSRGGYRCKAAAPGWLNGKHPRGSEGKVNRTVCFSYNANNCWHSTMIKIRNCGSFYVYWLKGLYYFRYSHYMRYCGAGETENNYPCKHYQLLTEKSRVNTYRAAKNEFCDSHFEGWYRFWGEAGHRMLEYCPVTDKRRLFICGSYNQGWLNTTNPVPLDGTVNRTVCFSNFFDCQCNKRLQTQIQMRNCGDYFVYKLKALTQCAIVNNARYCGMKDKDAYQVTCSANYMRIDLDRRYYNSSTYKSIRLLNPRCVHTLSYDYITLGGIPSACGSIKRETKTDIVYINAVKLTARFGSGLVSREHDETVYFKCTYKRDIAIDNKASYDPVGQIAIELNGFGNFSFNMNTFRKNSFDNPIKNFPVQLKLRDWLYFEVNATVQDSSLVLVIDKCYSTPNMDPDEPLQYTLIKERCPVDITTRFIPATGLRRRFSMQAFRYENTTTVYIHCLVFLCRKNSTDGRCFSGCFGNRVNRKRRDIASESLTDIGSVGHTGYYKLDSGQIMLDKTDKSESSKGGSDNNSIPITTVLFGVMGAVVVLLVFVVAVLLLRRKHPSKDKETFNKEIGIANEANDIRYEAFPKQQGKV